MVTMTRRIAEAAPILVVVVCGFWLDVIRSNTVINVTGCTCNAVVSLGSSGKLGLS